MHYIKFQIFQIKARTCYNETNNRKGEKNHVS